MWGKVNKSGSAAPANAQEQPKASFDVWLRWADVLMHRLTSIKEIYSGQMDAEAVGRVGGYLGQLRFVLDGALARHLVHRPYAQLNELSYGQDKLFDMQIQALTSVFRNVLTDFPQISKDMQKMLNSRWEGNCNGRVAMDIFRGPVGTLNEGIGSGYPRDGQLPAVLDQLLLLEGTGSSRTPRQTTLSAEEQIRWQDTARRWASMNSTHLRSAGRLD